MTPAHPNLSPFHAASAQLYRLPSLTDRRGRESAAGARGRGGAHGGRPALAPLYLPDPGAASPTRPQAPPPRLVQRHRPRSDPPRRCPSGDLSALRAAVPESRQRRPRSEPPTPGADSWTSGVGTPTLPSTPDPIGGYTAVVFSLPPASSPLLGRRQAELIFRR